VANKKVGLNLDSLACARVVKGRERRALREFAALAIHYFVLVVQKE
jgi:hypothetical protein